MGNPFAHLKPELLAVLAELDMHTMTPVQEQSLPPLLEGRDLVGQSQTGSGKTAAFALPILHHVDLANTQPQALVLCPTRELCTQVAQQFRKLGRKLPGLTVAILAGGTPSFRQKKALENGAHIAVGTPGRLQDLLKHHALDLRGVRTVVLDEADRMLDMGFEEQVLAVLDRAPKQRQTVLFSATFPTSLVHIARDPVRVQVESTPEEIEHYAYDIAKNGRSAGLFDVLAAERPEAAIVFCNLKATVKEVATLLVREGIDAAPLHGDLEQHERDRVMARFRNHSIRVLVATDVAARGLDIADLDLVVNYDLPRQEAVYTHRVGRTGRAGKKGIAVTLLGFSDPKLGLKAWKAPTKPQALPTEATMETLYISGGRQDKVRPGDILGALTGEAGGLAAEDVGKIEIHDRFSYVAVSRHLAQQAAKSLSAGKIKGKRFKVGVVKA